MKFSYNWLQSFFKKKLPQPEELAELLTMHSFEIEEIKGVAKDFILTIDIRPNRAGDCFSHLGIAREISAITGLSYREPFSVIKEDKKLKAKDFVNLEVKNKTACPRYTVRVINDVKIGSSPKWLKDRLKVCGLRPINNIVDIANYVMLETGQPLHAFDLEKLKGVNPKSNHSPLIRAVAKTQIKKIIVRKAKKGEKIITLDNKKYDLDEDILVIADIKEPLAIAGIKGGKKAEIDKKTKTVVLESANFNSQIIRRGSKKLNLKTDASLRFEHGIDPNLTEFAINRAAYLIQKIAKGKVAQGLVDFYPKKILPKTIGLNLDYLESLLGVKIPEKEIKNILNSLNFKCNEARPRYIEVVVPTLRLDVSIPEDLIEEIGRIYGYEKIPSLLPVSVLIPPQKNLDIFWEEMVKNILKETGFVETYNYSFISQKDLSIFNYQFSKIIEIENPTSNEYKYLRPSLIANLLKNVQTNQAHFKEIKIFELGKIFFKKQERGSKKQCREKKMLAGAIMAEDAFYEAKGVIKLLLNKLAISNIWFTEPSSHFSPTPEDSEISLWSKEKCAEIKINGEEIGFLGEISPKILSSLDIKERVVLFDIDFEKLSQLASEEQEYRPISRYPAAVRDIAVLVPLEVRVEEVLNKIEISGGSLIIDVDLFDIYEGEELPRGKKNLAFHLIFQSKDRTLTSKEIDQIQNKIIKTLEENPGWRVRK